TIITVSHDRGFIGRVANKILEINNGQLTLYPGTYDEYVWSLQKGFLADRALNSASDDTQTSSGPSEAPKFNYKEERKRLDVQIKKAQKQIQECDKKIVELNIVRDALTEKLMAATGEKAAGFAKDLHATSAQIEDLENTMLESMEH